MYIILREYLYAVLKSTSMAKHKTGMNITKIEKHKKLKTNQYVCTLADKVQNEHLKNRTKTNKYKKQKKFYNISTIKTKTNKYTCTLTD